MSVSAAGGSLPRTRPLQTIAMVLMVIGGLGAFDRFLARTEREEVQGAAWRSSQTGERLLGEGHTSEALDALRNAHTLSLDNATYELEMISALLALGRTTEADPLMDEVLQREPNDGAANLMAGRLMAKEDRTKDAEAYYHRAIYGEWPGNSASHRVDARFELVQYLVGRRIPVRRGQELMAELISLESEPDLDEPQQKRIAQLFLTAGSPVRATGVYQSLLAKDPNDADAYKGLGEAEMQQGDYRAARSAFQEAAMRHRDDTIAPRLELLNELIQLDPTSRRMTDLEKYQRSLRVLALAKGDLEGHLAERPSAAIDESAGLLKAAADAAAARAPEQATNESSERILDLAVRVWKARIALFGPSTDPQEELLRLLMERVGS